MKRVVIESPYSATEKASVHTHIAYARACVKDCLLNGEAPIVSHLLYTQPDILDDEIPQERQLGMNAGFAWNKLAELVCVYIDFGISKGMEEGIKVATLHNIPVVYRSIPFKITTPFFP